MNRIQELHHQAMDLAASAFAARHEGDQARALVLSRQALPYAVAAAELLADSLDAEPSRSVLYRSAATLAVDCGEYEEAERLIAQGLAEHPPPLIADELHELRQIMSKQCDLEQQLMAAFLAGDDLMLAALREQYATAVVADRDLTGVGFFTHFAVAAAAPGVVPSDFIMRDVGVEITGLEYGASAKLFVRDGLIDFLEVVTHSEEWPDDVRLVSIYYYKRKPGTAQAYLIASDVRDLDVTRQAWLS